MGLCRMVRPVFGHDCWLSVGLVLGFGSGVAVDQFRSLSDQLYRNPHYHGFVRECVLHQVRHAHETCAPNILSKQMHTAACCFAIESQHSVCCDKGFMCP